MARRVVAVQGDLTRMASADELALRAQLFVAVAASAARGVDHLRAIDWTTGEARAVELPIDPARGAREQIEALFKRARRLKEGAKIGRARLAAAQSSEGELREALRKLDELEGLDEPVAELDAIEARARAAAPRDFRWGHASPAPPSTSATSTGRAAGSGRDRGDTRHPPYRTFVGASGARILVGRGAAHNDALTLRVARPHDLWLHAKGQTGAHVVVALEKGASCPPDLLVEAAHLAAHFSNARDERVVDVTYTPRRYLRKPRGSAPGLVVVDREKVIVLAQGRRASSPPPRRGSRLGPPIRSQVLPVRVPVPCPCPIREGRASVTGCTIPGTGTGTARRLQTVRARRYAPRCSMASCPSGRIAEKA